MSGFFDFNKKYVAVLLAVILLLFSLALPQNLALADNNKVFISDEEGKLILKWTEYSEDHSSFNGYIISINGSKTFLDGYFFTYFEVTSLLTTPGNYEISVYANLRGDLSLIGSCQRKVVKGLDKVANITLSSNRISWDKVKDAKGYVVFVNNLFMGFTEESFLDFNGWSKSDSYTVSLLPVGKDEFHLASSPSHKVFDVSNRVSVSTPIYVAYYNGRIAISWQRHESVTYGYQLSNGQNSDCTLPYTTIFFDLEDGTYTFTLTGFDGKFYYDFGAVTFTLLKGEVIHD